MGWAIRKRVVVVCLMTVVLNCLVDLDDTRDLSMRTTVCQESESELGGG